MLPACNPSTREEEAGGLRSKASLGYTGEPVSKQTNRTFSVFFFLAPSSEQRHVKLSHLERPPWRPSLASELCALLCVLCPDRGQHSAAASLLTCTSSEDCAVSTLPGSGTSMLCTQRHVIRSFLLFV